MFVIRAAGSFDFWWWMSANLILFTGLSAILFRDYLPGVSVDFTSGLPRKLILGVVSAFLLYLVFLLGNFISGQIIPNASSEIDSIYAFKGGASSWRILILMLLVIGPGEELFWRGFLQEQLSKRMGRVSGYLLATVLYTGVHVFTGNFILIMAALVAGAFWGWMYLKFRSIAANVISHVIWDITIFLLIPIS